MEVDGYLWKSMEIHGYPWKSMEIRGKFQQALKMIENREKQLFTLFGFLPPYIGILGFLAQPREKNFSRSIDWYQKFFISRLVARYSAPFFCFMEEYRRIVVENLSNIYPKISLKSI